MQHAALGGGELLLGKISRENPIALLILGHGETPDAGQESVDSLDAGRAPGLPVFERPHKHLIQTERIGSVLGDDGVWIDHVAPALGHLHPILSQDQALVDEALERFWGREVPEVAEHLVPKAGIEEVKHGMLGATDVEIDATRLAIGPHPVLLGLLADEALVIAGIAEAEVVPAGACPLGHGIELARCGLRVADPIGGLGKRRLGGSGRLEVLHGGRLNGKIRIRERTVLAVLPDDGEGFAPVALTREEPVAEFVGDGSLAETLLLKPGDDLLLRLGGAEAIKET